MTIFAWGTETWNHIGYNYDTILCGLLYVIIYFMIWNENKLGLLYIVTKIIFSSTTPILK